MLCNFLIKEDIMWYQQLSKVHGLFITFSLIFLVSTSLCFGQGLDQRSLDHDFTKSLLHNSPFFEHLVSNSGANQIMVYPAGKAFPSLQDAFDFCAADKRKGEGKAARRGLIIVLPPGTYIGNFTLPADTILIGSAG